MAIYHLKAKVYTRSKGHSAVAAAAYRARAEMVDERTGLRHDYQHHSSHCLFEGIYAPKDAPDWTRDRAQLWNHVEAFETRRNAQLSREFEIALPHELTLEQQRYAVQDFVRENFTRKGLIADVSIHEPGREGDLRNVHAHIMVVMRKLDGSEFERNNKEHLSLAHKKAQLEAWRESWENIGNRHLARYGHEPTLDRRTLEAQGIEREPGVHLGRKASEMERRGVETDRGNRQREAANQNEDRAHLAELIAEREAAAWHEADKLNRMREAEAKSLAELAAQQAAEFARQDRERQAAGPEEMRRQWAERMRGSAAEAEAERSQAGQEPKPVKWVDPSESRAAWAAQLRHLDRHEAKRWRERTPANDPEIGSIDRLRETIALAWGKLGSLVDRLEAAFARVVERQSPEIRRDSPYDRSSAEDVWTDPTADRPRRSIWADELEQAQQDAAAARLRDTLKRPAQQRDHTRGRER